MVGIKVRKEVNKGRSDKKQTLGHERCLPGNDFLGWLRFVIEF